MSVLDGVRIPTERTAALMKWKMVGEVMVPGVLNVGGIEKADGCKQALRKDRRLQGAGQGDPYLIKSGYTFCPGSVSAGELEGVCETCQKAKKVLPKNRYPILTAVWRGTAMS